MRKLTRLMLVENVANLGIVGDVVEVRSGYARNYLLPQGLATDPTPANLQRVAARRAEVEEELQKDRLVHEALLQKLEGLEITLKRSANDTGVLFGSVTQHDIAETLREEGLEVAERDVRIGSPLKLVDTYAILIQLSEEQKTEIQVHIVSDTSVEMPAAEEREEVAADPDAGEAEEHSEASQEQE